MRFSPNGSIFGGSTLLWRWPLDSSKEISLGTKGTNCYPLHDGVALAYAEVNDWKLTQFAAVDAYAPTPFSNFTGNRLRAADGQWCATTSGMTGWFHGALSGPPNSYVYECCADALVVNENGGTSVRWQSGTSYPVSGSIYPDTVRVKDGLLSYTDTKNGTRQRVFDDQNREIPVTPLASTQYSVLAFRWNGDVWLIAQAPGFGNVIYKNGDTSKGIQFATTAHGTDLWLRPDGTGFVAYSTGPAETIGNNRRVAVNLANLKPLVPSTPEPEPLPVPDWRPSKDLSYVLTFYEPESEASYTLIEREADWTPKARGVFWTIDRDDFWKAADICQQRDLPLYAYWDSYEPYPAAHVAALAQSVYPETIIPAVMAYPHFARPNTERISDVGDSCLALLDCGFKRIALVLPFYRQIRTLEPPTFSWTLEKVLDMQDRCATLMADSQGHISSVLCFAWTRGGGKDGVVAFPEFQRSLEALEDAALGPDIDAPDPVDPIPPTPEPTPEPEMKTDAELQATAEAAANFLVEWRDPKDGSHPFDAYGLDTLTAEAFAWAVNRRDRAKITASFAEMGYKAATVTGANVLHRPQLPGQPDSRRQFIDDLEAASNAVDLEWLRR